MKKVFLLVAFIICMMSSGTALALSYTGSLTQGNLYENGIFNDSQTSLSWTVTQNQHDWTYFYHWVTNVIKSKNVYYLDFSVASPQTPSAVSLKHGTTSLSYALTGPSLLTENHAAWVDAAHTTDISFNHTFEGIKFDFSPNISNNSYKDFTLSFNSQDAPMWGSFFGYAGSTNNFGTALVYNTQFGVATGSAIGDGNNGGYLLTPGAPVPEPGTICLVGGGLLGMIIVKRKKQLKTGGLT